VYEPLARVGWDAAVPWFPGKGGRRTDRAGVFLPFGVKRNGTGGRRVHSALPMPGVLLNIIAQMFYSTRDFQKIGNILRFLILDAEIQVSTVKIMRSTDVATQARPKNAAWVATLQITKPTCVGFPLTESAQADFVGCAGAVLTAGIENMIM
jgi:hypothetical protein